MVIIFASFGLGVAVRGWYLILGEKSNVLRGPGKGVPIRDIVRTAGRA